MTGSVYQLGHLLVIKRVAFTLPCAIIHRCKLYPPVILLANVHGTSVSYA